MARTRALFVSLDSIREDSALKIGGRGDRKVLVTEVYPENETEAVHPSWTAGVISGKTPVQVMKDTELAVFTHLASQTRHFHQLGTEIYCLLEGEMLIEVEGETYTLRAGDTIVVNPGAAHQVLKRGPRFLCRIVAVNCGGVTDKFEL